MESFEKEKIVVDYFLENPNSYIKDIVQVTGFSFSSVQRYLEKHRQEMIPSLEITIEEKMKQNKLDGQRKGGTEYFSHHQSLKDSKGRFIGCIKSSEEDRELKKKLDILFIVHYYLDHYPKTLTEIAKDLQEYGYQRSYIHDCLHDSRLTTLLKEEELRELSQKLSSSRTSYMRKKKTLEKQYLKMRGFHD